MPEMNSTLGVEFRCVAGSSIVQIVRHLVDNVAGNACRVPCRRIASV
jgi:hypothetical protein